MTRLLALVAYVTRNLLTWQRTDGSIFVETVWNPEGIAVRTQRIKPRPFVMACRPLCGLDLHRPHLTCITGCRIRKGYYGKMSNPLEIESIWRIQLKIRRGRRFAGQKDFMLKVLTSIEENLLAN